MKKVSLTIFLLFFCFVSFSQSKDQVYAGIIMHIMKYVEWKNYKEQAMKIGVVNDAKLVSALNFAAKGKNIHFKNVEVTKLNGVNSIEDIDVLFLSKKSTTFLPQVMPVASQKNILVITEMKSESQQGSAINFIEEEGKLRFELYMSIIDKDGFKVSEQLKKFAILKI